MADDDGKVDPSLLNRIGERRIPFDEEFDLHPWIE
jgi:hypothetical protein